jgi:hypothetical protein
VQTQRGPWKGRSLSEHKTFGPGHLPEPRKSRSERITDVTPVQPLNEKIRVAAKEGRCQLGLSASILGGYR